MLVDLTLEEAELIRFVIDNIYRHLTPLEQILGEDILDKINGWTSDADISQLETSTVRRVIQWGQLSRSVARHSWSQWDEYIMATLEGRSKSSSTSQPLVTRKIRISDGKR